MNKIRKGLIAATIVVLALGLSACEDSTNSSQKAENEQQERNSKDLVNNQPLPSFDRSQLRQNLIELQTAQAKGVQSTTFFMLAGVPDPIYSCPSIGMPVASTTSLSNPWQVDERSDSQGKSTTAIGQMEPTGIYPGESQGTYVMCIDAQGHSYPDYWEGEVHTVMAPAKWNTGTHQVELLGPPSFKFSGAK